MVAMNNAEVTSLDLEEVLSDGSTLSNPSADHRRLFLGEDGLLHLRDSAGAITTPTGLIGLPVAVLPVGAGKFDGTNTSASAGNGWTMPIILPAPCYVRAMYLDASASGASAVEWGLFDYSASATAATLVATGSAAIGSTGWQAIAATGAPDVVPAGAYMLTWRFPTATGPTLRFYLATSALPWVKTWTTYTWDTTPDYTSASWVESQAVFHVYLECDMTTGGSRW